MTAESLMKRYSMESHIENGAFVERHYEQIGNDRAASGSIYYYVAANEATEFHQIDCDEYWCYVEGSPLEIWQADPDGGVTVSRLGVEEECEPVVYLRKGVIFASRHPAGCSDGTFLTCITVPRFRYEGFTIFPKETMLENYPDIFGFYEQPRP